MLWFESMVRVVFTSTYICSNVEVSFPRLWIFPQELIHNPIELHQSTVLPQVILGE